MDIHVYYVCAIVRMYYDYVCIGLFTVADTGSKNNYHLGAVLLQNFLQTPGSTVLE